MHANFRTGGEEGSSSATTTLHCTGFLWSLKISLKSCCFFNLDDLMAGERARERPSHQVLNKLCLSTSNMLVKENANRFPSISSLCCTSHVMTLFPIFGMMNIREIFGQDAKYDYFPFESPLSLCGDCSRCPLLLSPATQMFWYSKWIHYTPVLH